MKTEKLKNFCLKFPGATANLQWDDDRVFKIGGKMFACSGLDADSRYSFKVDDERFLELTDQPGIVPAPYLARARWVQIDPAACQLSDRELEALLKRSYEIVFGKLPKKTQKAILDEFG